MGVFSPQVGTQMTRGISGGERKRTNIGMELIIDPSVLFLDEPTTGLDASTANSVLLLLKRYKAFLPFLCLPVKTNLTLQQSKLCVYLCHFITLELVPVYSFHSKKTSLTFCVSVQDFDFIFSAKIHLFRPDMKLILENKINFNLIKLAIGT